jgi:hypothetical protein
MKYRNFCGIHAGALFFWGAGVQIPNLNSFDLKPFPKIPKPKPFTLNPFPLLA